MDDADRNFATRDMGSGSAAGWASVLDVKVARPPVMKQSGQSRVRARRSGTAGLNVSSLADYRAVALTGAAYSAAKAGVHSITEPLDLDERRHGLRACPVCPGEVATPILHKRPKPPSAVRPVSMLQPEDLAQTLLFVATLPQWATVDLLTMLARQQRSWTDEVG